MRTHARPVISLRSKRTDTAGLNENLWRNRPADDELHAHSPERNSFLALATSPSPSSAPRRATDSVHPAHPPHACQRCGTQRSIRPVPSKSERAPRCASAGGGRRAGRASPESTTRRQPAIPTYESDRTPCKLANCSAECNKKKRFRAKLCGYGDERRPRNAPLQTIMVRPHSIAPPPGRGGFCPASSASVAAEIRPTVSPRRLPRANPALHLGRSRDRRARRKKERGEPASGLASSW